MFFLRGISSLDDEPLCFDIIVSFVCTFQLECTDVGASKEANLPQKRKGTA